MIRLKIIVEGKTEELFVKDTLTEYLGERGYSVKPIIVLTSRKHGVPYRGGFRRQQGYEYAANYISNLIKDDPEAVYSTMFDFYAFPQDVGCYAEMLSKSDIYQQAECLERFIYQDVLNRVGKRINFVPYIEMHEFEAMLFTNPSAFQNYGVTAGQVRAIKEIRELYETAEHINNSPESAPSKRLIKIIDGYEHLKASNGSIYAGFIGIDTIRKECKHFNVWLSNLEMLVSTLK